MDTMQALESGERELVDAVLAHDRRTSERLLRDHIRCLHEEVLSTCSAWTPAPGARVSVLPRAGRRVAGRKP